jgi:hypothetical protein
LFPNRITGQYTITTLTCTIGLDIIALTLKGGDSRLAASRLTQ